MRRWGPTATLLAGLAVAAVVLGLSYRATADNADRAAAQQTPAAAQQTPGAEQPTRSGTQPPATASANPAPSAARSAKPQPPLNATWAGAVRGAGTLAIAAKGDKAIAYLCDGRRLEAWLMGTAKAGKLSLTGANGATLTGTFGNGRAKGTVTAKGRSVTFDVAAVKKPSGLYRASADVRGAKIVGGWIRLPNGAQVGLATVDGVVVTPSPVDTATGTATVGGATVAATPAEGELR